jgi:hydrogenase maturation protein HypF
VLLYLLKSLYLWSIETLNLVHMPDLNNNMAETIHVQVTITGLVQGVGFRPFVYREARELGICGEVENRNDGVYLQLQTTGEVLTLFLDNLQCKAPKAAIIENISVEAIDSRSFIDFAIVPSLDQSNSITQVSPDIAVCDDCLRDMQQQPHRIRYPFINCTHCGPRFSIIRQLPYDRSQTTMNKFAMCRDCKAEYLRVDNRRFHAQPIACNHCGPIYTLHRGKQTTTDLTTILNTVTTILVEGGIVAMKGMGGFHLMCDAYQEEAVARLRHIKHREKKPFAVMCRDVETVREIALLSEEEEESLTSWRRPIVLLSSMDVVAPGINNGLHKTGVMLPYLPFHYLLLEALQTKCVVLTSGNLADEPIVIDNETALNLFAPLVQAVLVNNRDIHNRCDDSVVMVTNRKEVLLRRSRGYAPSPIRTKLLTEGILGAGAELTNCLALGKDKQIILSQHIGDLKNAETFAFYKETYQRFARLFRFAPQQVVCDLHPNYMSSVFAGELSERLGIPLLRVQHHHAHIASCMAEHQLDEDVIAISMDGVGLGTDGNIWGGEFMVASLASYEQLFHFEYIPVAGGNELPYEPWKSALAYLHHYFGEEGLRDDIPFIQHIPSTTRATYLRMLQRRINTWNYSSAGRLFDAVSALTGVCTKAGFHAEAPTRLESVALLLGKESYPYEMTGQQISFRPMFENLLHDIRKGVATPVMSAKFHQTMVQVIMEGALRIHRTTGLEKVVLPGGTFQNALMLEKLYREFSKTKLKMYVPQLVPSNDGGIALGQVAIAAKLREMGSDK